VRPGRENPTVSSARFSVTVECRGCGVLYEKPAARSTVRANPGCPECGSLGWLPGPEGVTPAARAPTRSAGDPRRLQLDRAG
jgi:hypothetical protein